MAQKVVVNSIVLQDGFPTIKSEVKVLEEENLPTVKLLEASFVDPESKNSVLFFSQVPNWEYA